MRITNNYINNVYLRNLNNNMSGIAEIEERIASGKKINRPSDNPVHTSRVLEINNRISFNEQFQENINEGLTLLNFTQTSLSDASTLMNKAYEISLMGSDSAMDASERKTMAFQVDQLLQEMIDTARKKYQDKYIFGGTRTLEIPYRAYTQVDDEIISFTEDERVAQLSHDDVRKFGELRIYDINNNELQIGQDFSVNYEEAKIEFLEDGSAVPGQYTITYQTHDVNYDVEKILGVDANEKGVNQHYYQEIDEGIKVAMNITGYEAFEETVDVFDTLIQLRNNLDNNDQVGVNETIPDIRKSIQQIMDIAALAGNKLQRLDMASSRLTNNHTTLKQLKSSIMDIDMAKAAMELQQERNTYQSASYAARMIFESTLLNFLR